MLESPDLRVRTIYAPSKKHEETMNEPILSMTKAAVSKQLATRKVYTAGSLLAEAADLCCKKPSTTQAN